MKRIYKYLKGYALFLRQHFKYFYFYAVSSYPSFPVPDTVADTGRADMATLSEDTPRSTPRARAPLDLDMAVDTARADMVVDTVDMAVELVVDIPTSTAPTSGTVDLEDMVMVDLVDMVTVDLEDMVMVDLEDIVKVDLVDMDTVVLGMAIN